MRYSLKCFWVMYLILGLHTAAYATKTSLIWGTAGRPGEGVSTANNGAFQRNTWAFNFSTDDGIVHDEMDTSRRVSITKIRLMQRQTKASKPTSATLTQGGNSMAATSVISHDEETGMTLYDYNGNAVRTWSYHELTFPGNVDFDPTQDITLSFNGNVGCWVTQPANSVMAHQSWSPVIEITAFYAVDYMATLNGDVAFSKITSWQPARPAAFSEEDGLGVTNSVNAVLTLDESVAVRAFTFANADGKLTLKYVDASTLPAARYWDFTTATGKVAIDCSALKAAATLITGSIRGVANIDVAGSSLPAGGKLLVTDAAVRLQMIDKATWTGGAGDYDAAKPGNWTCVDFDGNTIPGAIPDDETTIVVNDALTADADWTVLGPVAFSANTVINLNGHNFAIAGFRAKDGVGAGAQINNDKTSGDFIVNVPEGTTTENTTVSIKGTARLVKKGGGTFVPSVSEQTYAGGTVVDAGIIKASSAENDGANGNRLGANDTDITVNAGGTFDINGKFKWSNHDFVLNGGILANYGAFMNGYASGNGYGIHDIRLEADSFIEVAYGTVFGHSDAVIELNGHTLSVSFVDTKSNFACLYIRSTIQNGTFHFGSKVQMWPIYANVFGENLTVESYGDFRRGSAALSLMNLVDASENVNASPSETAVFTVTNSFTPVMQNFQNTKLIDGATLNLSAVTGTWSATSALATPQTVTFAANAAITIDVRDRTLALGDKIVAWTAKPEGVTFQWDAETAAKGVDPFVTDEGVFYGDNIKTAHWTNELGDDDIANPDNWACTNSAGKAVSGVLPASGTDVYFTGSDLSVQIADPVKWASVSVNGSLAVDCDWSGLGVANLVNSSLDLQGHKLTVASLSDGTTSVAFTSTGETGTLFLSNGTTKLRTGLSIASSVDVHVGVGAVLDLNGVALKSHVLLMDRATISNTGASIGYTTPQLTKGVELAAGATAYFLPSKGEFRVVGESYGKVTIALNGGTLIKQGSALNEFTNVELTGPGTMKVEAGTLNIAYKGISVEDNVVFDVAQDAVLKPQANATLPTVTGAGKWDSNYTPTVTVTRYYEPLDMSAGKVTVALGEGATLGLRDLTGVWGKPQKFNFASAGVHTVDLAGRTLAEGEKIIAWEAKPTNVTFQWDSETAKAGVEPRLEADGLYYGIDGSDIDTARWTGNAGDYDATKPKNWQCTNFAGKIDPNAIPGDKSTLIVNVALTKDADWSVLGPVAFSADTRINLKGHGFTIGGLRAKEGVGAGAAVDNDATTTGDFVISVAEGKTTENTTVTIAGNTRLVKEGPGTFISRLKNQPYTGGTRIVNGLIKAIDYEKFYYLGAQGTDITIEPNGTLDSNGWYDWVGHRIVLSGGILQNTGGHMTSTTWGGFGDVLLTADSKIKSKYHFLFNDNSVSRSVNMGGHTLTLEYINNPDDPKAKFYFNNNVAVSNGTLVAGSKILFHPMKTYSLGENLTWILNGDYQATAVDVNLLNFTDNAEGNISEYGKMTTVTGRYAPLSAYLHSVTLKDGSTLDLTGRTGAWEFTCKAGSNQSLTIDENAAIAVDLAGRKDLTPGLKVMAWTDTTKPAESVTFTPKGVFYNLVRKADGLYVDRGIITIFR